MPLPEIILGKLAQFERRRGRLLVWRGLAEALSLFAAGLVGVALIEGVAKPSLAVRGWLSGLNYALAGLWFLWRAALPLCRRQSLRDVAAAFERATESRFQERILSAVQLANPEAATETRGISAWMVDQTLDRAAKEIAPVDAASFADATAARRAGKMTLAALAACGLLALLPGIAPRFWLALNPYAATTVFSPIRLAVTPGNCRLQQGTPLPIQVSANAPLDEAKAAITWDDGLGEVVPMSRSATNRFELTLPAVAQGFRYAVHAGDAESAVFTARVEVPPRLAKVQLLIQPPAYTGASNRVVEGGSAEFLLGSRVRVQAESTGGAVSNAEWIAEGFSPLPFRRDGPRLTLDLQPTNFFNYRIRLTGVNALRAESPQKWTLRPVPDEPPTARLSGTGTESGMAQRDEILPLQALASDDVGLQRVDLLVLSHEAEVTARNLYRAQAAGGSREFKTGVNFNLADLELAAGEEVQFQLVATDGRGQTTRSEPVSLAIGSPDKLREAQAAAHLRQLVAAAEAQLDYLRQMRSTWLSVARNFKDDDAGAQRPALTLLRGRLDQFAADLESIGAQLVAEAGTNTLADARFMSRFGSTLRAWGGQQRDVLAANLRQLEASGRTNSAAVFDLGRELFTRAETDLAHYRRVLAVLQETLETDVLATRCEIAQGRYQRGLPVMLGERSPDSTTATGPGLRATFFEGVDLRGQRLEQKIANPQFDNLVVAGNRREQWSARYEGDLRLPEAGDWTLACVVDDGVRLFIDGRSVLPADAWGPHSASQFSADLPLAAGWHGVVIEFYQGGAESKLRFLAARRGRPLQEVPVDWLRPPAARPASPKPALDATLTAAAKAALTERVQAGLRTPAAVPPTLAPMTNDVPVENFVRLVRDKLPVGETLATNLLRFSAWQADDARRSASQADELTQLSKDAARLLREELEKFRWRYEGTAALKEIQNGIEELREINNELRREPWHNSKTRTPQEQSKIDLAKVWQKQLERAAADAGHRFFEVAKQPDATLAERTTALKASSKTDQELAPAIQKLATTLAENRGRDEMAGQIDQRLNEISDRYRELNDMQEHIQREQVAADARRALPAARALARAQSASTPERAAEPFQRLQPAVARVEQAQRDAAEFQDAERLQSLAGDSPESARGKETAEELRNLAARTDQNPPSLAQTIPPPMQQQTEALDRHAATSSQAADQLARPRLAMALEASRLQRQNDPRTGVAYAMLGRDLGALLQTPAQLTAQTLRPLADRAAALAGQKGDEARRAEIEAANARQRQLAQSAPQSDAALAAELDELSGVARQAAGDAARQAPLAGRLGELAKLAPPVADWAESKSAEEIAASAANESLATLAAAPKQWGSYQQTAETLADAARQIRVGEAVNQLADLNPDSPPASPEAVPAENVAANPPERTQLDGPAGKAILQPPPPGRDQAEWSRLSERLRAAIRSSGIEHFSEEQQAAIRAYFERLSTEK